MATTSVKPGASVLNPAQTSAQVADVLGDGFPDGSFLRVENTDMVAASLKETTLALSTSKTIQAKKIQASEKTIELGPGLGIGAAGGEVLYHDSTTGVEQNFLTPRKPYSNVNGTAGAFTSGRVIGAFSTIVLQPGDTVLSNSVAAQVGANTNPNKVQFLYTITDLTDVMVTQVIGRFATAQTGVRMVIRHGSASGKIIFESEPSWTYSENQGLSVLGTGDTTFDTEGNPILFRSGSTYHITIESNVGPVVMKGAMVSASMFLPYISRRRAAVIQDPVVARGAETITTDQTFDALDWYETKYCSGTFAVRLPPIASSAGLDITLVNVGVGTITVNDNAGTTNLDAVRPGEIAIFESDGTTIRRVNRDHVSDATALAETIAGLEARVTELGNATDETGPDHGLMASVASISAQVSAIRVPLDAGIHASLASLAQRFDLLDIPEISGLQAAIASLLAKDENERQNRVDNDTSLAETIAGAEARIGLLESILGDTDDTGPDAGLMAALASIAAQVQALDIPSMNGHQVALASLLARLDALDIPGITGLETAVSSLRAVVDALPAPTLPGLQTSVASSRAVLDRHDNRLGLADVERLALAEALAGAEASAAGNSTDSQNSDRSIHTAIASISSSDERERQNRVDNDTSLAETVSGMEAVITGMQIFSNGDTGTISLGASDVWADVLGTDAVLATGTYQLALEGTALLKGDVVGNTIGISARFFDVTGNAVLEDLGSIVFRDGTLFLSFAFHVERFVQNNSGRTVRAQFKRSFTGAPAMLLVTNPRLMWRKVS